MGQVCCGLGTLGDSTAFMDTSLSEIARLLEERCGMQRFCDTVLYNPRTGLQMQTMVFMGPTYYQRLKHMTVDKIHSRGSSGPIVLMTRQPAEGRARDGGLRLGEMEVECLQSHGSIGFLRERLMECSDNYRCIVCRKCGMLATAANPERNIWRCAKCKNLTSFAEIRIPYSAKLLTQEIQSMGIATRFIV